MIRAKVKKVKPNSRYIDQKTGKFIVFMPEMECMIGKTFDFDKKGKDFALARSEYNHKDHIDEYHFMLDFAGKWLEPTKAIYDLNQKIDKMNLPDWINKIVEQNIL